MTSLNIQENREVGKFAKKLNFEKRNMSIRLACVEDGLDNIGFRKFSAYVKSIHSNTKIAYVPTGNHRSLITTLTAKHVVDFSDTDVHKVAKFLAQANLIGLSSMTQYSPTVYRIISEIRLINPDSYIVWGGIHAIIHPEDAIKHADAVCTGEGEFAFKTFLEKFKNGEDFTNTPSFWFNKNNSIIKNRNLPLMTAKEMDELPPLTYQDNEIIYDQNKEDFKSINHNDFVTIR